MSHDETQELFFGLKPGFPSKNIMTSVYNKRRLIYVPPDKGSFPLDHEGVCKDFMMKYMDCLGLHNSENTKCREEIKNYLDCRMNNQLMAKEPWKKLGFPDSETDS